MPMIKTAQLKGVALDWATAKADGLSPDILPTEYGTGPRIFVAKGRYQRYWPTLDWLQAGELLEKHRLMICPQTTGNWLWNGDGATAPLIIATCPRVAICRAVVAAVLGDEVDIPEDLA